MYRHADSFLRFHSGVSLSISIDSSIQLNFRIEHVRWGMAQRRFNGNGQWTDIEMNLMWGIQQNNLISPTIVAANYQQTDIEVDA